MSLQLSQFFPLCSPLPSPPPSDSLRQSPPHCSCPWVMHICLYNVLITVWQVLGKRLAFSRNIFLFLFKVYFIDHAITVVPFFSSPFFSSTLYPPTPTSSCPWVIHMSSLASLFPMLFLMSPCLFCAYQLCFLYPVPFSSILPPPLPHWNTHCGTQNYPIRCNLPMLHDQ